MRSHLIFTAMLVVSGSLFLFARLLERAHGQLTPEQLASLTSRGRSSWSQFLLPTLPILLGYALVSAFPRHAAWFAIPAMVLAVAAFGLQYRAAARRKEALDLPSEFYVENRKANGAVMGGVAAGAVLIILSRFV